LTFTNIAIKIDKTILNLYNNLGFIIYLIFMVKKIILTLCYLISVNSAFAGWNDSPMKILNNLKDSEVQKTALDNITDDSTK